MIKKMVENFIKSWKENFIYALLIIVVVFCLGFCTENVNAFDLEYRVNTTFLSQDMEAGKGTSEYKSGLEHEIRISNENLFLWGSMENFELYDISQQMPAIGIGIKKKLENFTPWIKVGYYMPENDQMIPWEPGYIDQQIAYSDANLHGSFQGDYYAITLDPNWGAEIGLDFLYEVYKNINFGLGFSYRALFIHEQMDSWLEGQERGTTGWILENYRDFSGFRAGIILNYKF